MKTLKVIVSFDADCYNMDSKELCETMAREIGDVLAANMKGIQSYVGTKIEVTESVAVDDILLFEED